MLTAKLNYMILYRYMALYIHVVLSIKQRPWFAGEPINYYYLGYSMAAFAVQLSGIDLSVGYNLALATVVHPVDCVLHMCLQ